MKEIPGKRRLISAAIFALLFLALSFYYTTYPLGGEKAKSSTHLEALEQYNKKAYKAALGLIEEKYESILEEKEGCELVISVFATSQKIEPTRQAAIKCMELGKAAGMAQEAYAMTMASVGKSEDAISKLELEAKKYSNPRIHAALAQLYVFTKDKKSAHKHLLTAISEGKPWSLWFARVFTSKTFSEDKVFLRNLVPVITKKSDVVVDMEFRLVKLLDTQGLTMESELMKKRLASKAKASPSHHSK
jgi:hypothetical protein